ncbi:MAG: hypothetical protein AUG51_09405 [Acidobacteria bacterium 13_1_20CM_3_53_8]|nr:MAG: hypothetical protein AUG51_09405 [Acidobacteria bacterium 13_1_20CM_3_53_8]
MSWKATAYVKGLKLAPNGEKVKRGEKLVLFVLADSHNEDRRGAWPSVPLLARSALLSARRVREVLKQCRQKGVICYESREKDHGGNDSNFYRFCALDCTHEPLCGAGQTGPPSGAGGEKTSSPPDEKIAGGGDEISAGGGCENSERGDADDSHGGDARTRNASIIEPPIEPPLKPPHTPARHPVAQAQRALPGVGVGSRFTQEEVEEWACERARRPGSKISDPYAVAFARYCDGKADEAIARWKASKTPEGQEAARADDSNKNLFYGEALQLVRTMVEAHGRDPLQVIAELPVADDVRARLVEKFSPNDHAEIVAALNSTEEGATDGAEGNGS